MPKKRETILMKNIIKKNNNFISIVLVIPALYFICYCIVPQYDIRDHEGYLAGAIILAGYISLVMICELAKKMVYIKYSNSDRFYIFSVINVIAIFVSIKALLFYHARVYVLSLGLFWCVVICYLLIRAVAIKKQRKLWISYISTVGIAGIISILSTVIRGMYILKWQVLLALVLLGFVSFCNYVLCEREKEFFPYDFIIWKQDIITNFKKRYLTSLVILLSLVVMYLILGPLEIYAGNMLSFSFGYVTFLPMFVLAGIVVLLVVSAIISLFTGKTYKLICVCVTAFSLLSYIQYIFMNTKLMEEDGARLRLDTMGFYPTLNLILWIVIASVIIATLYFVKNKWQSVSVCVCLFIAVMQMVAVVSLIIKCVNAPAPRYYQLTGEKMFTVAKDENVIVLMPDSFCRKYLLEVTTDDPSYMNIFKDFTYYSNMDSEYHPTFPSVIHLITGHDAYDGLTAGLSEERVRWQTEAWNSETCKVFFDAIKNKGYDFYMNIPSACELFGAYDDVKDYVKNVEYAESNVDKAKLMKMLFSMSIYRYVPYVIKPPFEYFSWDFAELECYNGKVAAYRNEDFYAEAKEGITIDESTSKKIHVINWHGFHEEYTHDEFCNPVPNAEEIGITKLQNEKGVMLCIETYLDKLKDIGMYDKSTIIIMGDHGKTYDGCVFIKLPNERHEKVIINDEPMVYSGFQQTILDMIGANREELLAPSWF